MFAPKNTPIRSEQLHSAADGVPHGEWAARPTNPPRSIFNNFDPSTVTTRETNCAATPGAPASLPATSSRDRIAGQDAGASWEWPLQTAIDVAIARSFLYRFLAYAFEEPTEEHWAKLTGTDFREALELAVHTLSTTAPRLAETASVFQSHLGGDACQAFVGSYLAAVGHAARGACPLNEIEYGDLKADPLFQPHKLADLAGFYRAFGLEVAEDGGERHDHLCLELEFMCVLAAKEAYALEHQLDTEALALGQEAQERFLRGHLGRWVPAFANRLVQTVGDGPLGALANLVRVFVETDCARYGIAPGSADLLLRPVEAAGESLCSTCGRAQLPTGP